MDDKNKRIAAARHKLQVYKQQQQRSQQPQSIVNQQDPIVVPENYIQNTHANLHSHTTNVNVNTQSNSQSPNPSVGFSENVRQFNTIETQENIDIISTPLTNPDCYLTIPPTTINVENFEHSSDSQSFEFGNFEQHYPSSHSSHHENQDVVESNPVVPVILETNLHSNILQDEYEMIPTELKSVQGLTQIHQQPRNVEYEHHYFNEFQQQSLQGHDAFELELSQLRHDNAHLSRREAELVGQFQEMEKMLQDLQKERDTLAQEIRTELGPLKDKVNILYEENKYFREKLEEMTTKVEIVEKEKKNKEAMFEEMQSAFILVSNDKMELAGKLDVENERVKVIELKLEERNSQIESLTHQNLELVQSAADLEKELDAYAIEHIDLNEKQTAEELVNAHAKIVLLEKELSELHRNIKSGAGSSGTHDSGHHHHHTDDCTHDHSHNQDHEHTHHPDSNHERGHAHSHEHGHDHNHEEIHEHDHHHNSHRQEHSHDRQNNENIHSHSGYNHENNHHEHENAVQSYGNHDNTHEHGHNHDHEHGHDEGHGHSHGNGQGHGHSHGDHSHDTEFGKGGHELSAAEKKQARLEWENKTYREELDKLASLLKTKTADATALSIYKEENNKMKNELARLEHMVIQLQGENDTIGDYITLYQSQRLALKEKALQKEAEMVTLGKEREQLRIQMNELNQILRSYNKTDEHKQQVPQLPVQKINELITEINTNFHPCGVCSGRLMNV